MSKGFWGPEIKAHGFCPEWLRDKREILDYRTKGIWRYTHLRWPHSYSRSQDFSWKSIEAFRLPANHEFYANQEGLK